MKKAALLRQAGYTVVEKWKCVFKKEKKTDPELQAFLQELEMVPPLNPRDAFYGGRTGAVALHCKVEEPDLIKYADVTSLYPWVNKYMEYPVRFPLIYTNPRDQDIHRYFGVTKVDILPPRVSVPPCPPLQSWWQVNLPSLCCLCERGTRKTVVRANQHLLPYGSRENPERNLGDNRITESSRVRVSHPQDS